jgi:hypothetical protein
MRKSDEEMDVGKKIEEASDGKEDLNGLVHRKLKGKAIQKRKRLPLLLFVIKPREEDEQNVDEQKSAQKGKRKGGRKIALHYAFNASKRSLKSSWPKR